MPIGLISQGLQTRSTSLTEISLFRDFERMLAEEGTTILKFFLHIDRDEQKKWYRNLAVSRIIIDALEGLKMDYPKPEDDLIGVVIE